MDDSLFSRFFLDPSSPRQRQYESFSGRLRRGLLAEGDRRPFRILLRRLPPTRPRVPPDLPRRPSAPLFERPPRGRPRAYCGEHLPTRPDPAAVSDARVVSLAPGRRIRSRFAGALLFLPLLAKLRFDGLVAQAAYPGSAMIPAVSALLSLLLLKLLDKERKSHVDDFNFDEALGLFAGLNVPPKKSFLTEYSYRTQRQHQRALLAGWVRALSPLLFPKGDTFSLDFHPIPYRGDDACLEQHHIPLAGRASPSVLSFFALEQDSRVLCYANANLTRAEQSGEVMHFVEFWRELTGSPPAWLYFDSKVTPYPELNRLNEAGVHFATIRRRGVAIVERLRGLPSSAWQKAVIDTPKRFHQQVRYIDERVSLSGYTGQIRQVAVDGLGREKPMLLLSNDQQETARNLIIRYAGRNRVEDGLGSAVNFFHLDCLASEVRLNVDLDCATTVRANGCYRWLGRQLKGFEKAHAKQLYRLFVETAGVVEVAEDRLVVRLDRRSHNPILREATLDQGNEPIPWLGNRCIRFSYS